MPTAGGMCRDRTLLRRTVDSDPTMLYAVRMKETAEDINEIQAAYNRMSFNLTYRYEPSRTLYPGGIMGEDIPNSYAPTSRKNTSSGEWSGVLDDWEGNPYLQSFANAINECVHEALEWVKVDGKPFLNPHEWKEADILNSVRELVFDLWSMVDHEALGVDE